MSELANLLIRNTDGVACERGLVVTLAQEMRKDNGRDDGVLDRKGTEEHAHKDQELDVGYHFHSRFKVGCVI